MYELNATSAGTLAMTGASMAQGWVGAWTLFACGLAMLSIAQVAQRRHRERSAER